MPGESNPLFWVVAVYCGAPLIGFLAVLWFIKTMAGLLVGGAKNIASSGASVPRQAIQTYGQVTVAKTAANAVLEIKRLEYPDNHEKVVRTRIWSVYSIAALLLLVGLTVAGYATGVAPGILLTVVDVAYGFYLMDKARQGKNPKLIEQRRAKRLASGRVVKKKNGG